MYLNDTEWARLTELTMLEVEVQVLAAEATVEAHGAEDADTALLVLAAPASRLAQLDAKARHHARRYPPGRTDPPDAAYRNFCIEVAAYGWRRDYDEWPTFANLTDRLANEVGIAHRSAARRILAAVNDPTDRVGLHAIRTARLAEIINDEPGTLAPWQEGEMHDLRLYITAEAMTDRVSSAYRWDQWCREAVA